MGSEVCLSARLHAMAPQWSRHLAADPKVVGSATVAVFKWRGNAKMPVLCDVNARQGTPGDVN